MLIIQYTIPNILPTNLACISGSKIFLEVHECMYIEWSTIANSISPKDPSPSDKFCCNQNYCQWHYQQDNKQSYYKCFIYPSYTHVSRHGTYCFIEPQHKWLATIHLLSDLATLILQLDNITKTCTKCY